MDTPRSAGLYVGLASLLLLHQALAEAKDYPRTGAVHNTQEVRSLSFQCRPREADTIHCTFVEVGVRPQARSAELDAQLASSSGTKGGPYSMMKTASRSWWRQLGFRLSSVRPGGIRTSMSSTVKPLKKWRHARTPTARKTPDDQHHRRSDR